MSPTLKSLGLDRLTRDEQLALVQELWNTIATEPAGTFATDEQRRELERRVAEDDASPADAIPWEQVKAEVLAQLRR
jgi:putative addiction module component (TIGR02574 family)